MIFRRPIFQFVNSITGDVLIQLYKATLVNSSSLPLVPFFNYDDKGNPISYRSSYFFVFRVPVSSAHPSGLYYEFFYTDLQICFQDALSKFIEFNGSPSIHCAWKKRSFA